MLREITFAEWKEQFKPIWDCEIFNTGNPNDNAFISKQDKNTVWTVLLNKTVFSGWYGGDTDGYIFITEIPVTDGERVAFILPDDYSPDGEYKR